MGFARELKDFAEGFRTGVEIGTQQTRAQTEWEKNRPISESDIEGTPDEPTGGGAKVQRVDGDGGGGSTNVGGENDVETNQIAGRLKHDLMQDFKLGDVAAGGIVASLAAESGGFKTLQEISPTVEGSRGGWGYAQWTGPRRRAFESYVEENDLDPKSYEANYGFLKHELANTEEGKVLKTLGRARDYRMATQMFTNGFLRPGKPNMEGRYAWADRIGAIEPFGGETQVAEGSATEGVKAAAAEQGIDEDSPLVQSSADLKEQEAEPEAEPEEVAAIPVPEAGAVELAGWDEFAEPADFESLQEEQQQILAGGLAPPRDQQVRPVMWAAKGGVIPEPTQSFAAGGMPKPMVDARQLGLSGGTWQTPQPAPVAGAPAAAWTPGRVGATPLPGASPVYGPGQLTPTQQKLKDVRAARLAAQPAPAAPVEPAKPVLDDIWKLRANEAYKKAARGPFMSLGTGGGDRYGHRDRFIRGQRNKFQAEHGSPEAQDKWMTDWITQQQAKPNNKFEEGGVIPEPEEFSFARGGKVDDRDETFQRLLREESRAPGRGGGDSARDRAARRMSQMEGRPSSTAYSPTKDTEYFTPAAGGGGGGGKGPGGGKGGTDKEKTGSTDAGPDISRNPFDTQRGTPRGPDRAYDQQLPDLSRAPYERRGQPARPERASEGDQSTRAPGGKGPYARPDARGTQRLKTKPGTRTPRPDARTQPAAPSAPRPVNPRTTGGPERPRPDARTQPAPLPTLEGVPSDLVTREMLPRPDPTQAMPPQYPPNEPRPERFGPEQPEIVPGAWLNGQFVPLNTAPSGGGHWLGYARGGAVPDEEDEALGMSQRDPGYTTSAPGAGGGSSAIEAERAAPAMAAAARRAAPVATPSPDDADPPRANVKATPALVRDVKVALDGGVRFIQKHFNIGNEGAVPTPEDDATTEDGVQRFAQGEGAATQEELNAVDDNIDPNRELDEGHRQMLRYAKTMRWYQSRGREDEAQAAAASYMQHGASRFSKLGTLAQTAYQNGDVDRTIQYLEKAYEMIPDGAQVNVRLNEETGKLEAIRSQSDGSESYAEIAPEELPGLIKTVQDKSMYWNSIFRLADPEGAKSRDIEGRDIRSGIRDEEADMRKEGRTEGYKTAAEEREAKRQAEEDVKTAATEEKKYKRGRADTLADQEAQNKEHDRQALLTAGIARAQAEFKDRDDINLNALSGTLAEISAATAAQDTPATDAALSKLWDALPNDDKRGKLFKEMTGLEGVTEFNYTPPAANQMAKPAGVPEGAVVKKHPKTGEPVWATKGADGKWVMYEAE